MAIATTTALAIGSLAVSAGSAAMSFGQAGVQKRKQEEAERKAAQMMKDARAKLDVNYMEDLDINKEIYDMQRDKVLQQTAGLTQAGIEGDARGAAATAGRVAQAGAEGQRAVRASQEQELNKLEQLTAKEDSRLRDMGVQLDLGELAGAQQAAADAQRARAAAQQQGFQSAASAAMQGIQLAVPLFSGGAGAQKEALSNMDFSGEQFADMMVGDQNIADVNFADMSRGDFRQFQKGLDPTQSQLIFGSEQFQTAFDAAKPKDIGNPFGLQYGSGMAGASQMDPEMMRQFMLFQQMMNK